MPLKRTSGARPPTARGGEVRRRAAIAAGRTAVREAAPPAAGAKRRDAGVTARKDKDAADERQGARIARTSAHKMRAPPPLKFTGVQKIPVSL
jgi:hypothetical protein